MRRNRLTTSSKPRRRDAAQFQFQGMLAAGPRADPQPARRRRRSDHARIAVLVHLLDAGQGTSAQEIQHRGEIVGRAITQSQGHHSFLRGAAVAGAGPRRHPVRLQEGGVETAQAAEARGQRDLGDRQRGFGQQLLGEQQPTRAVHADRRRAQAIHEQTPQLPFADAHALGQCRQRLFGQHALVDQLQRARHHFVAAPPCAVAGGQFRTATQAGAETRGFGGGGIAVIGDVGRLGRRRRTDRAAIDAGAFHRDEEQPVEARIAAQSRLFADTRVGQGGGGVGGHGGRLAPAPRAGLAVFGHQ